MNLSQVYKEQWALLRKIYKQSHFSYDKTYTPQNYGNLYYPENSDYYYFLHDADGKMNISALDKNYSCMVVSQFTLFADTKKGRRPSFIKAARPEKAIPIYEKFLSEIETAGFKKVIHGEFGADMQINLTNDGPVTIILDTDEWKAQ